MIPYFILPRYYGGKEPFDFIQAADLERARQRQIAKLYLNEGPSISNLYNAASAYLKSLPYIGISPADMNPYMLTGIAPTPSKVSYTPEQMSKYWMKLGADHATKMKFKTVMGPNGKMYADVGGGKLRSFEALGKEILGGNTIEYTPKAFKAAPPTKKISGPSIFNKPYKGRIYNTNAETANDL